MASRLPYSYLRQFFIRGSLRWTGDAREWAYKSETERWNKRAGVNYGVAGWLTVGLLARSSLRTHLIEISHPYITRGWAPACSLSCLFSRSWIKATSSSTYDTLAWSAIPCRAQQHTLCHQRHYFQCFSIYERFNLAQPSTVALHICPSPFYYPLYTSSLTHHLSLIWPSHHMLFKQTEKKN